MEDDDMKKKRLILILLVFSLIASMFVGCGSTSGEEPAVTDQGEDIVPADDSGGEKILRLSSTSTIPTANIHTSKQSSETQITDYIVGKLYHTVPNEDGIGGRRVPELAADYPQNPSGDQKKHG